MLLVPFWPRVWFFGGFDRFFYFLDLWLLLCFLFRCGSCFVELRVLEHGFLLLCGFVVVILVRVYCL